MLLFRNQWWRNYARITSHLKMQSIMDKGVFENSALACLVTYQVPNQTLQTIHSLKYQ